MKFGPESPESKAAIAYHTQGILHRVLPLMVIQGDDDEVVPPGNADRLIEQFAQLNDLADDGDGGNDSVDARADETREAKATDGYAYRIRSYHSASGVEIMREVRVPDLGHAWSGGKSGEKFSDPKGPDAARLFWAFAKERTVDTFPSRRADTARCRERYGTNFAHYWWYGRMSRQEYRCDAWGGSWRRQFDGHWTAGRCPR